MYQLSLINVLHLEEGECLFTLKLIKSKTKRPMKHAFMMSFCLLMAFFSTAQEGKMYPTMSGENLLNKSMSIPPKNGKVTLVALAYSEKSEEYLKDWRSPLFDLFIKAPGTGIFSFEPYDANIEFVRSEEHTSELQSH